MDTPGPSKALAEETSSITVRLVTTSSLMSQWIDHFFAWQAEAAKLARLRWLQTATRCKHDIAL